MALTLSSPGTYGKGKGKGKWRRNNDGGNGAVGRLANAMEEREAREQWNDHIQAKKEEEKEKREEKERNTAERKKEHEEFQKRADEQAERHNKEQKEMLSEIKRQNEERDRERKREDEERRARKLEEARQREIEKKKAREEERCAELERQLAESEAERRALAKAREQADRTTRQPPPTLQGRLRKRTKEPPSGDEGDDGDGDGDWRAAFNKIKKPRVQRAVAPIDVSEWAAWTATRSHANKITKALGMKSLKAGSLVGLDLLEIGTIVAPLYNETSLKRVHNTIVGSAPKSRWSREDIAVHFLSKIIGTP